MRRSHARSFSGSYHDDERILTSSIASAASAKHADAVGAGKTGAAVVVKTGSVSGIVGGEICWKPGLSAGSKGEAAATAGMSSHCEKRKSGGTLAAAGPGAGKWVVNSGAGTGRLGGMSERRSMPCSSALVHRCLLVVRDRASARSSSSSADDCGNDGSLRFCGRMWSSVSVVRRGRFTRESGRSSSSAGEGDLE